VTQDEGPEFKPQHCKTKKRKEQILEKTNTPSEAEIRRIEV
jgi:hypothetical protein